MPPEIFVGDLCNEKTSHLLAQGPVQSWDSLPNTHPRGWPTLSEGIPDAEPSGSIDHAVFSGLFLAQSRPNVGSWYPHPESRGHSDPVFQPRSPPAEATCRFGGFESLSLDGNTDTQLGDEESVRFV